MQTKNTGRLDDVRVLDGGYCLHFEYLCGRRSLRMRRFHAMFLTFCHPVHGEAVIDTGYSPRFFEATRGWPECLYRWAIPVPRRQMADGTFSVRHGSEQRNVRTVFLSHFHADHVGGLHHYREAKVVCDEKVLGQIRRQSASARVKAGILQGLLPDDLERRVVPIDRAAFAVGDSLCADGDGLLKAFRVRDYWEDGSVLLVDLPGHAAGHMGVVLRTETERFFYVADAYWDIRVLLDGGRLPLLSRVCQHEWPEYLQTQEKLRALWRTVQSERLPVRFYATHCPLMYKDRWSDAS